MSAVAAAARPIDERTEDSVLVAAARGGDDRAFEVLYERYQRRIAAYVRGMVHDHGRAEDITQDVFMSALRRLRATDCEIAFKPWIYEIAKNACIDAFRRSRRTEEVSFDAHEGLPPGDVGRLADLPVTPDAAMDTKQQLDDLRGAFGGLSDTHHEILVMREFEGLSYREIGERLGMTRPSVESTLFRARRRLSEEYDELVSGQRCVRVQAIIATAGGRTVGARDQRRLARHISHCQPCRRHARLAGIDLTLPEARPVAARIAAFLPLPAFLRRRWLGDDGGALVSQASASSNMASWSASVAGTLDPAAVAGWSKAVAAAATVAVAGVGAGAAISERDAVRDLVSKAPLVSELDAFKDAPKAAPGAAARRGAGGGGVGVAAPVVPAEGAEEPAGEPGLLPGRRLGGTLGTREPSSDTVSGRGDRGGDFPGSGQQAPRPVGLGDLTGPLGLGGSRPAAEDRPDATADDPAGGDDDASEPKEDADGPMSNLLKQTLGGGGSGAAGSGAAAGDSDADDVQSDASAGGPLGGALSTDQAPETSPLRAVGDGDSGLGVVETLAGQLGGAVESLASALAGD